MALSLSVPLLCAVTTITSGQTTGNSLLQVKTSAAVVSLKESHQPVHFKKTESGFIADILTSFGKQNPTYRGNQTLLGFRSNKSLMDKQGMFDFDDSITSVAIDVGAAMNPLIFDTDNDKSQMVLAFEPIFWDTLGPDLEDRAREVAVRGGCESRWETLCVNDRLVVFPSAMSDKVGHAKFRVAANAYCSSLNDVRGDLDPELVNSSDPEVRDVLKVCWGSLNTARKMTVPTVTLASILRRIPKDVRIKYLKIDAQGQDFKVLQSAADQMSRLEYVRFEMQVDPLPGRKMVADIPSYAEMVSFMQKNGFVHETPACQFDRGASNFSKAISEKECVFCRQLPCKESGVPPIGPNPRPLGSDDYKKLMGYPTANQNPIQTGDRTASDEHNPLMGYPTATRDAILTGSPTDSAGLPTDSAGLHPGMPGYLFNP